MSINTSYAPDRKLNTRRYPLSSSRPEAGWNLRYHQLVNGELTLPFLRRTAYPRSKLSPWIIEKKYDGMTLSPKRVHAFEASEEPIQPKERIYEIIPH